MGYAQFSSEALSLKYTIETEHLFYGHPLLLYGQHKEKVILLNLNLGDIFCM